MIGNSLITICLFFCNLQEHNHESVVYKATLQETCLIGLPASNMEELFPIHLTKVSHGCVSWSWHPGVLLHPSRTRNRHWVLPSPPASSGRNWCCTLVRKLRPARQWHKWHALMLLDTKKMAAAMHKTWGAAACRSLLALPEHWRGREEPGTGPLTWDSAWRTLAAKKKKS